MRVRPEDKDGDMMPVSQKSDMIEDAKAIAQIIKDRLLFYYGEWWEDETLGFRLPDFLAETVRKNDVGLLGKYITSYISNTEGVVSIGDVNVVFDKRNFVYAAYINTNTGSEVVEVNLNGLL